MSFVKQKDFRWFLEILHVVFQSCRYLSTGSYVGVWRGWYLIGEWHGIGSTCLKNSLSKPERMNQGPSGEKHTDVSAFWFFLSLFPQRWFFFAFCPSFLLCVFYLYIYIFLLSSLPLTLLEQSGCLLPPHNCVYPLTKHNN